MRLTESDAKQNASRQTLDLISRSGGGWDLESGEKLAMT